MGYDVELQLCRRHETDMVWYAHETLRLGAMTGFDTVRDPARYGYSTSDTPWMRAEVGIISILIGRLFAVMRADLAQALAPPFLVYNDWDERAAAISGLRSDALDFVNSIVFGLGASKQEMHNAARELGADALLARLEKRSPIIEPPFLWMPCSTLAEWIAEAEKRQTLEWGEIAKHPTSLAITRAKQAYLRELGAVDFRALFVFT